MKNGKWRIEKMIKISEIFSSIQGEQQGLGTPSIFVRLAGCSVKCDFCDSSFSWKEDKLNCHTEEELIHILGSYSGRNIIITGGEPLEQNIKKLCELLLNNGYSISLETNGKVFINMPSDWFKHINVSPKGKYDERYEKLDNVIFKFVIETEDDIRNIDAEFKNKLQYSKIFLMPKTITGNEFEVKEDYIKKAKQVWDWCKQWGYNFCPREHILLFGLKRGM